LNERRLKAGFPRSSPAKEDFGGIGRPASEISEEAMTPTKIILLAAGAAILALPGAASAQQQYGQPQYAQPQYAQPQYGQPEYRQPSYEAQRNYGQPAGDYGVRRGRFSGYPQFREIEAHIRSEIVQALRDDMIEQDGAGELMGQLRDIRAQETREYRAHGWNLPSDDDQRIRAQLGELDRQVDEMRDES
jgi:hypothetical protein